MPVNDGLPHKSLGQFQKDMQILQESLRMAYGPWTRKEKVMMKVYDVLGIIFYVTFFISVLSVPFLIYLYASN